MTIVRGPLVEEVHQSFAPWLSQVIRIYKDSAYAEVQFTVCPDMFTPLSFRLFFHQQKAYEYGVLSSCA
jgi:hypothetical protein